MVCGSGLPRVMNDAAKVLLHDIQRLLPRTGPRISILDIHIEITRHAYVCCGIYTYIYMCVYIIYNVSYHILYMIYIFIIPSILNIKYYILDIIYYILNIIY